MAHYVAELITKAENATGEEKRFAERICFDAILALWNHRAELPNGKRPFEELEPILRVIESLDPDNDIPRYLRSARVPLGSKAEESEAETWLKAVDGLDYSAKVLIGYCLGQAARAAADKSKEWVKLAEAAGASNGVSEIVIRFISSPADLEEEADTDEGARRQLEERLERLEDFTRIAEGLASKWREQLRSSVSQGN